ncbi:ABC transporter ATP-binding protein [Geitlerinema sp. CS-897]|nr:ABC transporter ATP-binding protein [Geitlerinema sp. CS-897]
MLLPISQFLFEKSVFLLTQKQSDRLVCLRSQKSPTVRQGQFWSDLPWYNPIAPIDTEFMLDVSLTKTFDRSNTDVLPFQLDVSFRVDRELVVLFGPSGCGKSSLLNAIAGLLTPDCGRIVLDGLPLFDSRRAIALPPHRRPIGYVFQSYALFPHLNVAQNIGFPLERLKKRQRQQRVRELAAWLHLEPLLDRAVTHISGGQAQRVAIARALACDPQILLLDEPFSALDGELRTELQQTLKRLQRQLNIPLLLVTHSRGEALELADRSILIDNGAIVEIDRPDRLLAPTRNLSSNFAWG